MADKKIEDWLSNLGLSQYTEIFEENGIEYDVLSELNNDLLKEMGVSVLGHRLKLTKAVAALGGETALPSDALTSVAMAERRQLTIMFCDLVGSTAISARLDPEDYRDLMTLYQETVSNAVTRAGGHVAKYLGDGVLIYFGYPIAQEDAAERATRTGFDIIRTVAAMEPVDGNRLQVRIGVATGLVVVGDLVGDNVEEASAVAGETPNLAARLQGLANPGEMVIGDRTHGLLRGLFEYERLSELKLKGFEGGRVAWRVLREAETSARFSVDSGHRALTPLIGRDKEYQRLRVAWEDAKAGEGQVFLVSGEAGIGKSRLVHEIVEQARSEEAQVQHFQAAPYFVNTAFYPIRRNIEHVLNFTESDDAEARLNKLEYVIMSEGRLSEARALLASLLLLPTERYDALNLSAALQKTRTIETLVEQLVLQSRRFPLLVHFDDLHWVDPTSLEFLNVLVDRIKDHAILLVATFRPEFSHDWGADHISSCKLERLPSKDIEVLLGNLAGEVDLSDDQRALLLARSDGVPLFAEELTRSVLEAKDEDSAETLVPDSLQDSLMARLDKLVATRELAQIGSVIGREFDVELMSEITGTSRADVSEAMSRLIEADLVFATPDARSWTFRHALLQDAAYQSMLRRRRQSLHEKIAVTLEEKFPERCEKGPEQVANHFVAAGKGGQSVPYWLTAGKTAWARASAKEALAQLSHGLEFVKEIPNAEERAKLELQLQSTIGVVHFAATSYASPQAQAAFERARELFDEVETSDLRVAVLYGVGAFETMRGDIKAGHATFDALAEEAGRSGNARYEVYSSSMQAWSHFNRGDYKASCTHGERVLELYDAGAWDKPGPRLSAADPKVISECFRAAALWSLGYPDQALKVGNDILEYARSIPDPYSLVYALSNGVIRILEWLGLSDRILELTDECAKLAAEYGYGFLSLWASHGRAWAMAEHGKEDEAEKMVAGAVAACKGAGVNYHSVRFVSKHAVLLLSLGRTEQAAEVLSALDEALKTGGELSHQTELEIAKAKLELALGNAGAAADGFRSAMQVARDQSALSWELKAALELVPLLESDAEREALIAPIYARFEEGFETRDLKAAARYLRVSA